MDVPADEHGGFEKVDIRLFPEQLIELVEEFKDKGLGEVVIFA
jgi:hypothetical protein